MATAILDKLLQSQWGKSFIMWVFLAMIGAITALGSYAAKLSARLSENEAAWRMEMDATAKQHAIELDNLRREQMAMLKTALETQKQINQRIQQIRKRQ